MGGNTIEKSKIIRSSFNFFFVFKSLAVLKWAFVTYLIINECFKEYASRGFTMGGLGSYTFSFLRAPRPGVHQDLNLPEVFFLATAWT